MYIKEPFKSILCKIKTGIVDRIYRKISDRDYEVLSLPENLEMKMINLKKELIDLFSKVHILDNSDPEIDIQIISYINEL